MTNKVDKLTERRIKLKKSEWAILESMAYKEGFENIGLLISSKIEQGKL